MLPLVRQRALEKRELLLKQRMLEKREEKRVLEKRQPMEEGTMRANRRVVKLAKEKTPQERMPQEKTLQEKTPEERAKVLLEKRHRARTRRSNRQR
jgi:hypothetical protein